MPEPDLLAKLLDAAESHARRVLIGTEEELIPIFHLMDAAGQGIIVATPFAGETEEEVAFSKNMAAAAVRRLIIEHKIVRYAFLSEAWMVTRCAGWEEGMSPRPSKADDRVEVVLAIATDGADYRARRWRIRRKGETCIDLVLDSRDDETMSGGGRFDNLLSQ